MCIPVLMTNFQCCKAIFESDKSEQNMSAFQTDGTSAGKSADTFVSVKK